MTTNIDKIFIDSFDAEVKKDYQGLKVLRDTVRVKTGVVGSTHYFPKSGQMIATKFIKGNNVVPQNLDYSRVKCDLVDWTASDYIFDFDKAKTNISEVSEVTFNIASSMGRREDQLILDALETVTLNTVGGVAVVFNTALIGETAKVMNKGNIPMEGRTLVWSAEHMQILLDETKATSTDFNSVQALVKGEMKSWYGFDFKLIGDRAEGGLIEPTADTSKRFSAYHKASIGLAIGKDMETEINYIAEKLADLAVCKYSAGAVVIDEKGVVKGEAAI